MLYDPTNFLLSLAAAIAAITTDTPIGTALFVNRATESPTIAPAYSTLRIYGGSSPDERIVYPSVSVNVATASKDESLALALAQKVFAALYTGTDGEDRTPRHHWLIPGKKLPTPPATALVADSVSYLIHLVKPLQPPGLLGMDESQRCNVSFNFDVEFHVIQNS